MTSIIAALTLGGRWVIEDMGTYKLISVFFEYFKKNWLQFINIFN